MDRRGQGISINVIIIAAIGLLILVILSIMVIRGSSPLGKTCETTGGTCKMDYDGRGTVCDDSDMRLDRTGQCPKSTTDNPMVCCAARI